MTDTENVVRDGIVKVAAMTKPNVQVTAKPGQIVFIAIPFTFCEKIPRPFGKAIKLAINRALVWAPIMCSYRRRRR